MKKRIDEFINTMDYSPVLTIGQFMDDFRDGLERDGKLRQNKPVFIRTLTGALEGDGSKSLLQRWKDMSSNPDWYADSSWFFPVIDVRLEGGEITFAIDSRNFAGRKGGIDAGIGPREMWARLARLRDEEGIGANTRVSVRDDNTGRTLWMYRLRRSGRSKFSPVPLKANIFDPAAWFDANNAAGVDQSFGVGAETPEWFQALKRKSDAGTAPFGHRLRPEMRQRFRDAGLGESRA